MFCSTSSFFFRKGIVGGDFLPQSKSCSVQNYLMAKGFGMTWNGTKDAAKAGAEDGNECAEDESSVFDLDDSGEVGIAL